MAANNLLLWVFVISSCFVAASLGHEAIIGGARAANGEFPYHATVYVVDEPACGGVIVDPKFIVTAAHCVVKQDGDFHHLPMSVLVGTNNLHHTDHPAEIAHVHEIFIPDDYQIQDPNTPGDIAVLRLKHALTLSKRIKSLQLPEHQSQNFDGKEALVTGFGWDWIGHEHKQEVGNNSDSTLRFSEAHVLSTSECQDGYAVQRISDKQLCARVRQHPSHIRGVCSGDSGGPLVHDNILIGIMSRGPHGCDERIRAAIYTRVSKYLDFIHNARHGIIHNMKTVSL